MSLKTSFYNKSILKSDLKRFWWVSLLETIILFLTNTLPLWYRVSVDSYSNSITPYDVSRIATWENLQFLIPCAFAITVVAVVFSYMHQVASVSFYHSIPVTRRTLFTTKIISSLKLTIIPIVINTLIMLAIVAGSEMGLENKFSAPLLWLYTGTIYTVLMVSVAVFMNMMTGTPIGTVVFSMGVVFLPLLGIAFYDFFCNNEVFGFWWASYYEVLEWIYISEENLLKFAHSVIYFVMIASFILLAYQLYKKRKLEMYGEVIAFSWLKPVFVAIISVIASMLSYSYLGSLFGENNIFFLIPLGLLGTIIAWMVSRKSLSLKGIFKPVLIYIISALVLIGFVRFDISGFEGRIPDVEDVLWVDIIDVERNEIDYLWIDGEQIEYTKKGRLDTKIYDEEGIANVIAMHTYAVRNHLDRENYQSIPIEYKLKNGRTLVRKYRYNFIEDAEILEPVYDMDEIRAKRFTLLDGSEKKYTELRITDRRVKGDTVYHSDDAELIRIVDALKKDLSEISYHDSMIAPGGTLHIGIDYSFMIETDADISQIEEVEKYTQRGDGYIINGNYKNTMQVLDELGFLAKIPTADDIISANVEVWRRGNEPMVTKEQVTYDTDYLPLDTDNGPLVTDRAEISELYGLLDEIVTDKKFTDYNNCINVRVVYNLSDHIFEASCSYDEDKLPDIFRKYMP